MFKKTLLTIFLFFILSVGQVEAFKAETFVSFSHQVAGSEGWKDKKYNPLSLPKLIYQESTPSSAINTWFLRFDALNDSTISAFFNNITQVDTNQFLGGNLELTPTLLNTSHADNLNGKVLAHFSLENREKIITTYMETFFTKFGFYPQSVTLPFLDSHSLNFLKSRYSVLAVYISPDNGIGIEFTPGYASAAYFPDKNSSLIPAKKSSERINIAVTSKEDFFSPNLSKILTYYDQKGFNEFTHLNLVTQNTDLAQIDAKKIKDIFSEVQKNKSKNSLNFYSLSQFGNWFIARYPESTPATFFQTNPNGDQNDYLYQNPWYKIEMSKEGGSYRIKKLIIFNRDRYEDAYDTILNVNTLSQSLPLSVSEPDELTLGLEDNNLYLNYLRPTNFWTVNLQNQTAKISFENQRIVFTNIQVGSPLSSNIKVENNKEITTWNFINDPLWFKANPISLVLWVVILILFFFLLFKGKRPPFLGLFVASISLLTVVRSGALFSFGMGFWGPNGHDSIFHLSIINHFKNNLWSLSSPQYSGISLKNYHFFFDYLSAFIIKFTGTPANFFYFVIFPVFSCLLIVKLLNLVAVSRGLNNFQRHAYILFFFLGSSFGYIAKLLTKQNILSGESAFWANQSVSLFLNPPYVLSIIILLTFVYLYSKPENHSFTGFKKILLLVLLGSLLAQTKVYAFILLVLGLFLVGELKLSLIIGFLGLIISKPFTDISGVPFNFDPLWFPRSMFASFDRVYWPRISEAWQVYETTGSFLKLYLVNIAALVIFLVGNLGVRLIGLVGILADKTPDKTDKLIKIIIVLSLIIPLVITQKINPWNSIQFMYYGLSFLALYTAKFLPQKLYLSIPLILLGILGSFGTLADYTTHYSSSRLSYNEVSALKMLFSQEKGLVLSPVFDRNQGLPSPKPLYDYVSTPYISAFSEQQEFLSDTINLEIMGVDYSERSKEIFKFYSTTDHQWASEFLAKNNILYVYENQIQKMRLLPSDINLIKIFDSSEVNLYKLDKHVKN